MWTRPALFAAGVATFGAALKAKQAGIPMSAVVGLLCLAAVLTASAFAPLAFGHALIWLWPWSLVPIARAAALADKVLRRTSYGGAARVEPQGVIHYYSNVLITGLPAIYARRSDKQPLERVEIPHSMGGYLIEADGAVVEVPVGNPVVTDAHVKVIEVWRLLAREWCTRPKFNR